MEKNVDQEIDELSNVYCDQLWNAVNDPHIRLALSRAIESFRKNRDETLALYPHVKEKARQLIEVKEYSLTHWESLAKQLKERI